MKKITFFTGTRAEYGLMKYLIKSVENNKSFKMQLIVGGSHLNKEHGLTINEILEDNLNPSESFQLSFDNNISLSMAYLASEAMMKSSIILEKLKPNLIFLLGDRYETFAVASAAFLLGIPIAHLHGGEKTKGALDDNLRDAITHLSSWHFTSAKKYKERVISLIEKKESVFEFGPMILDGLINIPYMGKEEFERKTGFKFALKNLLITYHPETRQDDNGIEGLENLLLGLEKTECNILFTHPNADNGRENIVKLIEEFYYKNSQRTFILKSLGQDLYLNAMRLFDAMAGNSSSGIIEAPFLSIPVLNIGDRQKGRIRSENVIDVDKEFDSINKGLKIILTKSNFDLIPRKIAINKISPSKKIVDWLNAQNKDGF